MEQSKFYQIKNITEHEYTLVGCDGSVITRPIQDVDKSASAFTIQDAKDGDVLLFEGYYNSIVLFQGIGINGKERINYHCKCDLGNYSFGVQGDVAYLGTIEKDANNFHPATKEQRDLLFSKMKEAGYEWDAEKKELTKINKQICYHNDSLYYAIDILEKTFGKVEGYQSDDGILEHKAAITAVKELYEQKPAEWSEEDEKMIININESLYAYQCKLRCDTIDKENAIDIINDVNKERNWIKSLKDKVFPQPKQEWSEEDEKMLNEIIEDVMPVGECPDYPNEEERKYYYEGQEKVDWLKSLKPNHWKPSKEQIEALKFFVDYHQRKANAATEGWKQYKNLKSLYDDLKNYDYE